MGVWNEVSLDSHLEVGRYYLMEFRLPISTAEWMEAAITKGLKVAEVTQNAIRFTGIEFFPMYLQQKRDGTLLRVRFQAIPNDAIYEAGLSPRVIVGAIAGVLLILLSANGTIKRFAMLADDTVNTVGKVFDPGTLVGIALVLLILLPALRKG